MVRKAKRQTEHRADVGGELERLTELAGYAEEVMKLLLGDIRSDRPTIRAKALTRWGPALEVYKGALKDIIRYKLSAKDLPVDTIAVQSESGVTTDEKAIILAAMNKIAAIPDEAETEADD